MSTYCNHYKKDDCDCYDKKKHDGYDKKHDDHDKKKKKDCRAILECGREIVRSLPTTEFDALNPTTGDQPIPLAEVTIDTTKLYKPCVKTEYSSIINSSFTTATPTDVDLSLTFRLVRKCKGEDEEQLRTWTYERTIPNLDGTTSFGDSFTVTFCECFDRACCDEKAGKCCTYTLQLVQATSGNMVSTALEGTYTISQRDISAQAACPSCVY